MDNYNKLYKIFEEWGEVDTRLINFLIDHNVMVMPYKIGDTVWELHTDSPFDEELRVMESKVENFYIGTSLDWHHVSSKALYASKKEAEEELLKWVNLKEELR